LQVNLTYTGSLHSMYKFSCPFSAAYVVQWINPGPSHMYLFRNKASFYGDVLLAHRPTPKLEDHLLSAARDCLFNIFEATLQIRSRSSIRNLRTCHAVVTGTHLSWLFVTRISVKYFQACI
jgi:hypothetical protein